MLPRTLFVVWIIAATVAIPTGAASAAAPLPVPGCDPDRFEKLIGVDPDSGEISDALATDDGAVLIVADDRATRIEIDIRADNWVHMWTVTASGRRLTHQANPVLPLRVVDIHAFDIPVEVRVLPGASIEAICTYGGDDTIDASAASSSVGISSGAGDDVIFGSGKSDLLFGGPGDDRLLGDQGDDTLDGGDGLDKLDGGDGRDRCGSTVPGRLTARDILIDCEKPL